MLNNDFEVKKFVPESKEGIYAIADRVTSYKSVKNTVLSMTQWLNDNNGNFPAPNITAYAIAHNQVAEKPLAFFIVHKELVNEMNLAQTKQKNNKNFWFPAQAIFNAEIVDAPEKVDANVPKREVTNVDGKVGSKITVEKGKVSNKVFVPDGCMSFPHRTGKNTERYYRIKVRYQTVCWLGFLWTRTEWVEGLKAHIFQHEIDHAHAINIYYKK